MPHSPDTEPAPTDAAPQTSLAEMRGLLAVLPAANDEKPRDAAALGRLAPVMGWLHRWRGKNASKTSLERARLALFAAGHGVVAARDQGAALAAMQGRIEAIQQGVAAINRLCLAEDCELRLYEMALDFPSGDISQGPAMDDAGCATAMAYGMMAVEQGLELVLLAGLGRDGAMAAQAVRMALTGMRAGRGTNGVDGRVDAALERWRASGESRDPLAIMAALGGYDMAAMAGAIIAARIGQVPIILDGEIAETAALVLERAKAGSTAHCLLAQAEDRNIQSVLGNFDIDSDDGSAAVVAAGVAKLAAAL